MENNKGYSENDFLVKESDEILPVPNEPFEGESFDVTPEMNEENKDRYYEVFDKSKKTMIWSVISFVLGIASVAFSFFGWAALILGILAIVFAVVARVKLGYFDGKAISGLMLGIFGIVFGVVMIVWKEIFSENLLSALFENKGSSDGGSMSDI